MPYFWVDNFREYIHILRREKNTLLLLFLLTNISKQFHKITRSLHAKRSSLARQRDAQRVLASERCRSGESGVRVQALALLGQHGRALVLQAQAHDRRREDDPQANAAHLRAPPASGHRHEAHLLRAQELSRPPQARVRGQRATHG